MAITNTDARAAPDSSVLDRTNAKSRAQLTQVQELADFYPPHLALQRPRGRAALVVDQRQEKVPGRRPRLGILTMPISPPLHPPAGPERASSNERQGAVRATAPRMCEINRCGAPGVPIAVALTRRRTEARHAIKALCAVWQSRSLGPTGSRPNVCFSLSHKPGQLELWKIWGSWGARAANMGLSRPSRRLCDRLAYASLYSGDIRICRFWGDPGSRQ